MKRFCFETRDDCKTKSSKELLPVVTTINKTDFCDLKAYKLLQAYNKFLYSVEKQFNIKSFDTGCAMIKNYG